MIIPRIITQHVDEAAFLSRTRALAVLRPDHRLQHLADLDDRLDAHVDGLRTAGAECRGLCNELLGRSRAGACFAPALLAIERGASSDLEGFLALSQASAVAERDVHNAFAWADPRFLRGIILGLLRSAEPFRRRLGIAVCAMHRVDPGSRLAQWVQDEDDLLSVLVLQAAAELARVDMLPLCLRLLETERPERRFWAAWAAVMLGSRGAALDILKSVGFAQEASPIFALDLVLKVLEPLPAHELLARMQQAPALFRGLLKGSGTVGNPEYIPWLIHQMSQPRAARLAGEAFSTITGLDLSGMGLDRRQPEDFNSGPNDDPRDRSVEMDEDDGLPWPDHGKIQSWWRVNSHRFQPGVRYFMGEPLNRENCLRVLKEGFQRQRIAAAYYLALLNPGTPLFEWRAPAWRQQRLLATMT